MEENTQVTQGKEGLENQETEKKTFDNSELEAKLVEAEARASKAEANADRFK